MHTSDMDTGFLKEWVGSVLIKYANFYSTYPLFVEQRQFKRMLKKLNKHLLCGSVNVIIVR